MKGKVRYLILILLILLLVNVLFLFMGKKSLGISFDEEKFVVRDTSSIASIKLNDMEFTRSGRDIWLINGEYRMDPSLNTLLFSILKRVRVQKPVDIPVGEGVSVALLGEDPMEFTVWGNPTKTRTYFSMKGEEEVYQVQIPGYNEYVGGVFELNKDQWRDRVVMNESWRTIQKLTLDYRDETSEDLEIEFDDDFFIMEGVQQLDSNKVVAYLNQFQYFQVNEWLSPGRIKEYDSLSTKPSFATLTIESINSDLPIMLEIFPKMEGDRIFLVMTYDESLFVVDDQRMSQILLSNKDFKQTD